MNINTNTTTATDSILKESTFRIVVLANDEVLLGRRHRHCSLTQHARRRRNCSDGSAGTCSERRSHLILLLLLGQQLCCGSLVRWRSSSPSAFLEYSSNKTRPLETWSNNWSIGNWSNVIWSIVKLVQQAKQFSQSG